MNERCAANDDFLRHFLAHETALRAWISLVVGDAAARDDVFQEVALALWKNFHRYDEARPFGAWARRIAAHKAVDAHRRRVARPVTLSPEAIEALNRAFDAAEPTVAEEEDALAACLAQLPEKSRQLLDWRYAERLDAREMARRAASTPDAIYQQLSRLRAALGDCIRRRLGREAAPNPARP